MNINKIKEKISKCLLMNGGGDWQLGRQPLLAGEIRHVLTGRRGGADVLACPAGASGCQLNEAPTDR